LVLLPGKDLIALAQTGSGKTGAFALPIIQDLLENREVQQSFFACVLSPTRSVRFLKPFTSLLVEWIGYSKCYHLENVLILW